MKDNHGNIQEYKVIAKEGKVFLRYIFIGSNITNVDDMKIYGIGKRPFVRRFSTKIYLEPYMVDQVNKLIFA